MPRELAGWRAKPQLRAGTADLGRGPGLSTQGHLSQERGRSLHADLLRNRKRDQAALIKITHPGLELMNIQQPASGGQLRSGRAHLGDCALASRRAALSSRTRAAARQGRQLSWRARPPPLLRPPRPKKEPQALIIPKNAAEEQKLQVGTAHEEPGETRRGLTALPSPKRFLPASPGARGPSSPVSERGNSRSQSPGSDLGKE